MNTSAVSTDGPWNFAYTPGLASYTIITNAQIMLLPDSLHARMMPQLTDRVTVNILADGSVQLVNPSAPVAFTCDSLANLAMRSAALIPKVPVHITASSPWSDSATVEGCQGDIPVVSTIAHTYTAIGDTVFNGVKALHVQRSSLVTTKGEGSEGQHRVQLSSSSAGNADLFFDVTGGHFLGTTGTQTSKVDITTSGRVSRFVQRVTEQITLMRTP